MNIKISEKTANIYLKYECSLDWKKHVKSDFQSEWLIFTDLNLNQFSPIHNEYVLKLNIVSYDQKI
jgi:hypothetical protein